MLLWPEQFANDFWGGGDWLGRRVLDMGERVSGKLADHRVKESDWLGALGKSFSLEVSVS